VASKSLCLPSNGPSPPAEKTTYSIMPMASSLVLGPGMHVDLTTYIRNSSIRPPDKFAILIDRREVGEGYSTALVS
jgi:hypothetical protein